MVNFICFKRFLEEEIVNKVNNNESFIVCFFLHSSSTSYYSAPNETRDIFYKALLTKHLIIEEPSGIKKDFIIVCWIFLVLLINVFRIQRPFKRVGNGI